MSSAITAEAAGATYSVYYPTRLDAEGGQHPMVVWGSRRMTSPAHYASLLQHLASWGFVVAAPDGPVESGDELLAAISYLRRLNDQPSSPFYRKLDTTSVGALGHCEGARGAVNAAIRSPGLIGALVLIDLPDRPWGSVEPEFDLDRLTSPVFLVTGSLNWRSSEPEQKYFYQQVPGTAAKVALKGVADVEIDTRCHTYVAAWLRYILAVDDGARQAFVGDHPELATSTSWENLALKHLP